MKIAMPVNDTFVEGEVCPSFGRTPYFMVYDTETKESKFFDNEAASSQGGAGIKAAQIIVDKDINVLLTPRCGDNAAEVIGAANIEMYKVIKGSIKDNIDAFSEGKLSRLGEIHEGFHNHGAK